MFEDYTTESMERTLILLQACEPFNYTQAAYLAHGADSPTRFRSAAGRAGMLGQALALHLWRTRMSATLELRQAS
jgi:hypothetical protein